MTSGGNVVLEWGRTLRDGRQWSMLAAYAIPAPWRPVIAARPSSRFDRVRGGWTGCHSINEWKGRGCGGYPARSCGSVSSRRRERAHLMDQISSSHSLRHADDTTSPGLMTRRGRIVVSVTQGV